MAPWVHSAKKSSQNGSSPDTTMLASSATKTQLRYLSDQRSPTLQPHGATVQPSRAVQAGDQAGRQCQQDAGRHDDEGGVEIGDRLKSEDHGGRGKLRGGQHEDGKNGSQTKID